MKKIKIMILSLMLMCMPMVTLAAHAAGCTKTTYDTNCCTKTFNITAKTGYTVTKVLVNGVSQSDKTKVTLGTVSQATTIKVETEYNGPYTITFNGNGSTSGSMNPIAVAKGSSITLTANAFTKTSYKFKGWATSSSGSVTYNNSASVTPSSHLTLYAVWEYAPSITITSAYGHTAQGQQVSGPVPLTVDGTSVSTSPYTANVGCSITVSLGYAAIYFNGTSVGTNSYTFTAESDVNITTSGAIVGQVNPYTSQVVITYNTLRCDITTK